MAARDEGSFQPRSGPPQDTLTVGDSGAQGQPGSNGSWERVSWPSTTSSLIVPGDSEDTYNQSARECGIGQNAAAQDDIYQSLVGQWRTEAQVPDSASWMAAMVSHAGGAGGSELVQEAHGDSQGNSREQAWHEAHSPTLQEENQTMRTGDATARGGGEVIYKQGDWWTRIVPTGPLETMKRCEVVEHGSLCGRRAERSFYAKVVRVEGAQERLHYAGSK